MTASILRPTQGGLMDFERAGKRVVLLALVLVAACDDETTTLTRDEALEQLQIDEAVEAVNQACAVEDFLGDCIAYQNPRCEQGQCVADPR
jgi:hypothetical protein